MSSIVFERPECTAEEFAGRPGVVRFLEVPPRRFVMIDGEGPAGEAAFAPRMPWLYGTAYPLRFALKKRGVDEKVRPLEVSGGRPTARPISTQSWARALTERRGAGR